MTGHDPRRTAVFRRATKADAEVLARLIDLAGEGIPTHLWAKTAQPGEAPLAVGIRRAAREEGGFSYRNAVVAEEEGRVAGMLLGYRQPDPYDTGDLAELPEVIRPAVELEALAPGSWYVNGLAVFPEFQGRGLGTRLLRLAEGLAQQSGASRLSLIVAVANRRAVTLYERQGYRAVAARTVAPIPGLAHGGDFVLMVKDAPAGLTAT